MNVLRKALAAIRFCVSRMWNRQTLVFLFFLALSTAFWLFQALNEVYEQEFPVKVQLQGLPEGIVVTGDFPQSVQVTLSDKGATLLNYKYGDKLPPLVIDYTHYEGTDGHARILTAELLKPLLHKLAQGTRVVSVRPDTIDLFYGHGHAKRVPVRLRGNVSAGAGYHISGRAFSPDSITVQATDSQLDTIKAVYIRPVHLHNLTATQTLRVPLQPVRGATFSTNQVALTVRIDQLVEKKVSVPITGINFPEGEQLRTFPSQVEVTFQVGMSLYRSIDANDFAVVADYHALSSGNGNKCRLILKQQPAGVSAVRLSANEVEYVVENTHP